ncbi:putative transposable element [Trichonephila clavipes]|uniref:Putative transposable element n=1 Tax=Trichonephila clavipes TaxID=2585209 RepID=A0A8X6SS64_TRICX|nr:putative transposable element [Trichonephila clavipes]
MPTKPSKRPLFYLPGHFGDCSNEEEGVIFEAKVFLRFEKSKEKLLSQLSATRLRSQCVEREMFCNCDEAHFWLNGYVNKQNCRIWSEANPQVYVEIPLNPEKLTVWCALWAGGILLQKRSKPQRYSQW